MVDLILNNILLNYEDFLESYECEDFEYIDIVANCMTNSRAIARIELDGCIVSSITYIIVVGAKYDENYECVSDYSTMKEQIVSKSIFDAHVEQACKWVIECF